jgi:hypothetical protein
MVEFFIQIVFLTSGALCAYLALPGTRSFRSGVTFVYIVVGTAVTIFVGLGFECSRENCL